MMFFSLIFSWWLLFFVISLIFYPSVYKLFKAFPDKGYAFSKTVGIIAISFSSLVFSILKILPYSKEALILIAGIFGILIFKFFKKEVLEVFKFNKTQFKIILITEIIFFVALSFLAFVRAQEPSIRGLEKFMDFGFMQSVYKSTYFPPLDMWYGPDNLSTGGYPINYYYFGHLVGATIIKLHGVDPAIGYNMVLATVLGLSLIQSFSLTTTIIYSLNDFLVNKFKIKLKVAIFWGFVGAFLTNLAGNLHTIYVFTTGYPNEKPIPFWQIFQSVNLITTKMQDSGLNFLDAIFTNSLYWYPNATRFIPFTIHEFPSYSYVVADLHGHVYGIPFVLLTFAVFFIFFNSKNNSFSENIFFTLLTGFLIAINYMTNAFDGPIYILFFLILLFFKFKLSKKFILLSFLLVISFIISSTPFSAFFKPFASAVGVNCAPDFLTDLKKIGPFIFEKGNCQSSDLYMILVLWGFFMFNFVVLYILNIFNLKNHLKKVTTTDKFVLLTFLYGLFLILVPEFFYAKDIYPGHFRANTMFKMGYQAYILMSISSVLSIFYIYNLKDGLLKISLKILSSPLIFLVSIYPLFAFPGYYPAVTHLSSFFKPVNLDGSKWLKQTLPAHKEIIDYLNDRIVKQPVVLEAQGDSYTDYNVISSYTGLPTVAGWFVHQWLWRGSSDIVGKRVPDIITIYTSTDLVKTRELLKKYKVEYVVVTNQEREKYKNLNEEKFKIIGSLIFKSSDGSGALYKVY